MYSMIFTKKLFRESPSHSVESPLQIISVHPQASSQKHLKVSSIYKQISIMGNFLTKPTKWNLFNKKENDEDWATKSNWICKDQLCPNPYTHARGDPCKLTMEDLFPSRPEPPTSENTKQPDDESEDWLIEWDRENMDRQNN
jgi:hypothetical protein